MKIAFATDDGTNISSHFGRAEFYIIVNIVEGKESHRRLVSKVSAHNHQKSDHTGDCDCQGNGRTHGHWHRQMFLPLKKCSVLIARGMGEGAFKRLHTMNVQPILTSLHTIDEAIGEFLKGTLRHQDKRLHQRIGTH